MTNSITQTRRDTLAKCLVLGLLLSTASVSQNQVFHSAPASAKTERNPYQGQNAASGKAAFQVNCVACHGPAGEGSGNIPSLASGAAQGAGDGELFWYITQGDVNNGMPSWQALPEQQRWEIVNYVRVLGASKPGSPRIPLSSDEAVSVGINSPPPRAPFTDYRFEKPGTIRKITPEDLPAPLATTSAGNAPQVVARPEKAWPEVPAGFKVDLYATGLDQPRLIRTAPNGDFFVAESRLGEIRVFRGITGEGKPEQSAKFATGLKRPFGINFYPAGPNPQWVYVGNTDSVVRIPYKNGDLQARGPAEHIADLPSGAGHWTRDIQFTPDGKKMFVSVGSASNINDPDTTPEEKNRADVLEFNPDGSAMHVYAYGIRNCVGLAIQSKTGALWCSVNERDGLGDDLVPDYITRVQEGGFYGWPWWYMGKHQDPRHAGKHPDLRAKVITPDVILHPHNASLQLTFYDGKQFPAEYQGDIFAAEHGSWNRSVRVGYELIRVPLDKSGNATGAYEDFMTGFVVDNGHVWGRPVGVTVAPDGSLLVTDDGSKSLWRISYTGTAATPAPTKPRLTLTTDAFEDGGIIPNKFTAAAEGTAVSPKLTWSYVPEGTVGFALILHDPDTAPLKRTDEVLHWLIFNIPGTARGLPEGVPPQAQLPDGSIQGLNYGKNVGYVGMGAAAVGPYHHYTFELFALDTNLALGPEATQSDVMKAMDGHILMKGVLVGRFHRP